jgi:ubiquitin carboxyl-terminal hydrolase 4/11/15
LPTNCSQCPFPCLIEERLDDENMLYCSGCKKHVQAMKTVTLWRIPKILVVHLKRFEYRGTFNRSKIGVLVDFPLDGLDLDSHSPQSASGDDFVDDRVPLMYDLFGVVNHYGRMGYGHYTAHARRWDETGLEMTWTEFDDENVTDVANTDSIVSPAAYVLFYKRRLFL